MAVYNTDLTLISDCYNGPPTVVEMGTPYDLGNLGAIDLENFIEGAGCVTQETKNAVLVGASVCVNNLSAITMAADDVVFIWMFFAVGAQLYTYANSGHVMIIGSSTTAYDAFAVSGSDKTPNPYGGWYNFAVDPTQPPTTAYGGGSTAHQYFGSGVSMLNKISKGNPHAIDAIRYGRGEIYCTGIDCTFTGMAAENDDNTGSQNRWGLFQDVGGSYLWKGLMSFGQTATAATFSHTGATIAIDDMLHVYSHFNKIEFNHADTDVTLNNITFNSLSTVSPGSLEMIANCTVAMTGCVFNDMDTFIFDSGADLNTSIWAACGLVTQGGATFDGCTFNGPSGTVGILVDDLDIVDNCTFNSDGTGYAMELDPSMAGSSYTMTGCSFVGYAATDGSTGNECIYNNTGGTVTIGVGTGQIPTVHDDGTSSTIITASVPVYIIVKDEAGLPIQDVQTAVYATSNRAELINQDTDANGEVSVGYTQSTPVDVEVRCRKSSSGSTKYKNYSSLQTIATTTGLSLAVTMIEDPNNNATT